MGRNDELSAAWMNLVGSSDPLDNSRKTRSKAKATRSEVLGDVKRCSILLQDRIANGTGGDEQVARGRILSILARFRELCQDLQRRQEKPPKTYEQVAYAAGSMMMQQKEFFDFKKLGDVPGVLVGDWYSCVFELVVIGLHKHLRGTISYVSLSTELAGRNLNVRSVACSIIVLKKNVIDDGTRIVFIGQGPNYRDQRAELGNLALLNSCKTKHPVRVIRRHEVSGSLTGRIYTYIGLYTVQRYIQEKVQSGFKVFKFFLRRQSGQANLQLNVQKQMSRLSLNPAYHCGLLTPDISQGLERTPVRVVNVVDVQPPDTFHYTANVWCSDKIPKTSSQVMSCKCNSSCIGSSCFCVAKNRNGVLAYSDDGRLKQVVDIVYECGSHCNCGPSCRNKVSQMGLKYRLEIFKTHSKGWGVRTLEFIPSGSFVCELTGELITSTTASKRENDEYLFDLDFQKGAEAREKPSTKHKKLETPLEIKVQGRRSDDCDALTDYVIDAREYGNVARFINHSCDPNLFVQGVLYDHDDMNRGHIMLFAGDDIPAFTELAYDYGYELNSVYDHRGKVKVKECHCGAKSCRKRLY